ncbi:MAG: MerR family DNA-binding transcriptional regulator [Bacillota bacterium]
MRLWEKKGLLVHQRTSTGHRRYNLADIAS